MKKFKLLYLSCHSIAEYDEVKLLTEMGIEVFSHGAYSNPNKPGDPKRPGIKGKHDQEFEKLCKKNPKENLSREFIKQFDVIFCHWTPEWLKENWEKMRDKVVIWRTNGQSCKANEDYMRACREDGMKIVRYADIEKTIPGFIGQDAVIRFYKDPEEFKGWNGRRRRVINVTQNMKARAAFCGYNIFLQATAGYPRKLYGPDNSDSGKLNGGLLSYENLKKAYRDNRAYFYTGTKPACYTLNFIEAWMTGIPIVATGGELSNPEFLEDQFTYEIPFLGKNGEHFLMADDIGLLNQYVGQLLDDPKFAKKIGDAGREQAIKLFGKDKIKKEWKNFFDSVI